MVIIIIIDQQGKQRKISRVEVPYIVEDRDELKSWPWVWDGGRLFNPSAYEPL